ncbi:uncharacterized protein LOC133531637 [Cydia pomonella]|uniref:uncharacterized protein LOC133531637 n=1 Tax=Cydia pomonella TaxID=82600 RepID=UPI002ADD642D|nr:uncharacterized protein LOC133531637 [Cydia pomonella]
MYRTILFLLFVARVKTEPKSFQHEYYVSRQSRNNAAPMQTGYVMSRMDNKPPTYQSFGNPSASFGESVKTHSDISTHTTPNSDFEDNYRKSLIKFTDMSIMRKDPFKFSSVGNMAFTATESIMPFTKAWDKHSMNYEIAKAKSKFGLNPSMSIKAEGEYMKDRVTNLERYSATEPSEDVTPMYDYNREFHIDDDDVKTLSGHTLEWWPYFLHSPYEYESIKMDSQIEKAKEKRYAIASAERVIPVHEHHEEYSHGYTQPHYDRSTITGVGETPIPTDNGYISYTIKDFGSNYESDPLELSWGNAFDTNDDIQNTGKRNRRLDEHSHDNNHNSGTKVDASNRAALGDSSTEKTYEKKHEFNKHESGDSKNHDHNTNRAVAENNESAYKDIVDQFANRYGGEDHKRHSSFALKRNSDNGEKRKGFRKVYHKDEYQEENEFFDNTKNSANAEDSGSSISHLGGSTAAVHSHAAAAAGNKANAFNDIENSKKNSFENNHKGHDVKKGLERDSNRYKDISQISADRDYTYYYP